MIKYIKRKDLDTKKYDDCIQKSIQSRLYAFSWYLDIVADNWDVLVLDDYKAVMPIPWKRKFGIKYVTQPYFCQQLGVFSVNEIKDDFVDEFINKIPNSFKLIAYQFNSQNRFSKKSFTRKNYLLNLQNDYSSIKTNYRKDRKYRINQASKLGVVIVPTSSASLIKLFKKYYSFLNLTSRQYKKITLLINTSIKQKKGFIIGAKHKSNVLGASFFIKEGNRVYYLFSAVSTEGKEKNVASLLINYTIKQFCNTNIILDFEGSMTPGIASFYKSFGAELEEYQYIKVNKLYPFI